MQSGILVRVEDPTETALVSDSTGQTVYAGTEATFEQVLLHEIGHALGFGDNANSSLVMSYYLTAGNRTLGDTDLAGAASLYSGGLAHQTQSLISAMAAFSPPMAAETLPNVIANNDKQELPLAANNGH